MKKLTSLILAGLFLLTSCNTGTTVDPVTGETIQKTDKITESSDDTEAETEEIVTRTTHLTGVFEKELLPRLGDNYYSRVLPPEFDENGNFRIWGKTGEGDNRTWGLLTLNPEGEILHKVEANFDPNLNMNLMTAFGDSIYCTERTFTHQVFLYAAGSAYQETPILLNNYLTPEPELQIIRDTGLCTDGSGNVYVSSKNEVVVFAPDLTPLFYITPDGGVDAMNKALDGTVYIASGEGDSYGLYPVDVGKKALGTPKLLGELRIENLFFAEGYDFYYTDYETAVFGADFPSEEGKPIRSKVVLDFQSSGVSNSTFTLSNVVDPETMVVVEVSHVSSGGGKAPVLYRKAPDRPLDGITVIEVAYTTSDYYFEADVMEFNRTHKDIMVVLQDYSRFDNEIDPDAGETRLAMDVVTGVYRPDIILGTYDQPVVRTTIDSGSYVDLNTYLTGDPAVSKETIFPSVLYSYSTDDGKVWGLPLDFEVQTLVSNNAVTGGLTEWDFPEMMDYIASLPREVSVMAGLSRDNVIARLLGNNAYSAFVDLKAGTCNFDTPKFAALLEFIKSLPKEERPSNSEEEYLARHSGAVSLYRHNFSEVTDWLSLEAIYNSKDYSLIGFPVSNGSEDKGAQLDFTESYTILSSSEHPDEAWEFIRFMLSDQYALSHFNNPARNLPILTEKCREMGMATIGTVYDFRYEMGGYSGHSAFNEEVWQIILDTPPREPSARVIPTAEMIDGYISYLSNSVGQRIVNRLPDEINDIVNEEIKTYLTGVKDAKACANVIQSRVNIWLAEHE